MPPVSRPRSIDIVGGGPAGLYAAILIRRRLPAVRCRLFEQNPPGATFGFGVVFSDRALDFLAAGDARMHALIAPRLERWRDMVINHPDGSVTLDGVGFAAIGRLALLDILRAEAESRGAELHYSNPLRSLDELDGDLVIGADGLNSLVRSSLESAFEPEAAYYSNRFAWFGTDRPFATLTQTFVRSEHGPLNAHHYRYAAGHSTFIVECGEAAWHGWGFDRLDEAASARRCASIFADVLAGAPLVCNRSHWRQFPRLWCRRWFSGRHVLIGDAAHSAHFSVGSGTRLAMEDALALVDALAAHDDLAAALAAYQAARQPIAGKIVAAANASAAWYEDFGARLRRPPLAFAHDYLTRSGRIDDARLCRIAPAFAARYLAWSQRDA